MINMTDSDSSFHPTADLETLRQRSELLTRIRQFFETRNFIHVETPLVSRDTVVDRHIEPASISRSQFLANKSENKSDSSETMYLQTSPEFAMKRLLASGATAVYQICKAFRQGELGRRHNPEFTMLEWYRTGDDYFAGMNFLADLVTEVIGDPLSNAIPTPISYRDAFRGYAELDPWTCEVADFQRVLQSQNVDASFLSASDDRDLWLNLIMSEIVEPQLGVENPVILFDYPESQAALAQIRTDPDGTRVAERFELYIDGVELANGYHELLDADELQRRNIEVNRQRRIDGTSPLPESSRLLGAMRHGLPDCCGVALGLDRLAMVLFEKESIDEVIAFPFDRA